ncbi:MAG: SDR family oxidoreductase [Bacteroidota bacterium]
MQKIAILGAGWLGWSLAQHLAVRGNTVRVSTTRATKREQLAADGFLAYQLTVMPEGITGETGDFFAVDTLIVTLPPGGRRDPAGAIHYPQKVRHIITAARAQGVQQLLFTSSTGVYGNPAGVVDETSSLQPETASGRALVQVEKDLRAAFGEGVTILRLAGLVGGERQPGRWFAGKEAVSGGDVRVNLVHRDDVIRAVERVLAQGCWGKLLNICADQHPIKADFYPAAAERLGLEPPTFTRDGQTGKIVDNSLSKQLLGMAYDWNP